MGATDKEGSFTKYGSLPRSVFSELSLARQMKEKFSAVNVSTQPSPEVNTRACREDSVLMADIY